MNITNYQLGIIWSIGSYEKNTNRFRFRHKERYFLEQIQAITTNIIYFQKNSTKGQYAFITSDIDIMKIKEINWTERNSNTRILPFLEDYKDFLRAYIEIHSSIDYSTRYSSRKKGKKYKAIRLRIYGNVNMLEEINTIFNSEINVGLKTVEILKNNKTGILNYASTKEIETIYRYIEGDPCFELYWNNVYEKLKKPRIFKI